MKTKRFNPKITNVITTLIMCAACITSIPSAIAESYLDFSTTITDVYINQRGWPLMKIAAQTNTPEGFLVIPGGLQTPGSKAMYATALTALATQRKCWIRVEVTATGYYIVDIINISNAQ